MENKYVSRAGEKLEAALKEFKIDPKEMICGDFGCNAGGFTDCLLKYGAKKVYAVDTGYGMLDWNLRNNPRVVVMERTNAIHVKLEEKCDLICLDLGWTTQEKALPNAVTNLKPNGVIISLIKPHYEAKALLFKLEKGVLKPEQAEEVTKQVIENIKALGLIVEAYTPSPLTGKHAGNTEYLTLISKI